MDQEQAHELTAAAFRYNCQANKLQDNLSVDLRSRIWGLIPSLSSVGTIKIFCLEFYFSNMQFLEKTDALVGHCTISGRLISSRQYN